MLSEIVVIRILGDQSLLLYSISDRCCVYACVLKSIIEDEAQESFISRGVLRLWVAKRRYPDGQDRVLEVEGWERGCLSRRRW